MKYLVKRIYEYIPFKKHVYNTLKLIYTPKERVFKHLLFNGLFRVKLDKNRSFKMVHYGTVIENELFWLGLKNAWEKESLKVWSELCKEANGILDIGANTGLYALIAKTIKDDAEVHAFEPVERVFERLKKNVELNSYDIHCHQLALSNKRGKAVIFDIPEADHIYSVTVGQDLSPKETNTIPVEINTTTLDYLIDSGNIGSVDLIKLDVETHEPEVLQGFSKYLEAHCPTLLIEVLNDEIGRQIEERVKNCNYLFFDIDENKGPKLTKHIRTSSHFNYLLCKKETAKALGLNLN